MTRQRKWQLKQEADGKCMTCAEPRNKYTLRCDACQDKFKSAERKRHGYKPWKPGGPGRPPSGSGYEPRTASGIRYRKLKEQ